MSVPDAPSNLPPAHYFNEDPEVPSARKRIDVSLPDGSFSIETDTGVFSHGRVDSGTKVLLMEADALKKESDFILFQLDELTKANLLSSL